MPGFALNPPVFSPSFGRGHVIDTPRAAFGVQRLPTDSIGSFVLTLINVIVGSSIRISTLSGETVSFQIASASTVVLTIPAYTSGVANNSLLIRIRKGGARPVYQSWESQTTAVVGGQSVFVSQIPDE